MALGGDLEVSKWRDEVKEWKAHGFNIHEGDILWFENHLCVTHDETLWREILDETHKSAYTVHPGATKMYHYLRQLYWWEGMKRDVGDYISRCLTCQQVKAEHQKSARLLQQIELLEWK